MATGTQTSIQVSVAELFDALRRHAQANQMSVLELLAEHLIDDLPINVGRFITEYLEERKPKVQPGEVRFEGLYASGRTDLSERIEEIIYGPDDGDDE